MGLSQAQLHAALDALRAQEPTFARALDAAGYPEPRIRERGHVTLLRTIVGQQVSVAAAASIWTKMEGAFGTMTELGPLASASDEALRAVGLSRQKASYVRSLADEVASGRLDFTALSADDEEAIAALTRIKGVGRWSAEIYLLFAEGRPDIWPAGDLAVQAEIGRLFGHDARPSEKALREMAETWRPHRGAAAIFAWHSYGIAAKVV